MSILGLKGFADKLRAKREEEDEGEDGGDEDSDLEDKSSVPKCFIPGSAFLTFGKRTNVE
eukprot:CAMPEP_0167755992 /NCGR_PEP_ID=MMETSP0110_2-20121227/9129_1 /TAXON_ID=629695 /ORGANISM="Gymnochlora sp., Strain CCMP2014" /LENGTH=59 /DNA_ID=CAMNT_0007642035 /DNA_START=500 /DNA_END=679 /DNA_ORIENTATION=+